MHQKVATWLNLGGIAAPLVWASTVIYSGSLHPEYSHVHQYISDLAARGSSTQHLMQAAGFILPGLMMAGFGVGLGMRVATTAAGIGSALLIVSGLARGAAGVFLPDPLGAALPPTFEAHVHNAAGVMYGVTFTLAVLVWFLATWRDARMPRWFAWYSLVTVVAAVVSSVALIGAGLAAPGEVGLFQRAWLGALNIWLLVFAAIECGRRRVIHGDHPDGPMQPHGGIDRLLHEGSRFRVR
jgi:hypothetical membrane protein